MKINVDGIEVDLKVGCDPEVFATKNNKLVSAHGLVKGDKDKPFPVSKGAIQVDGMALEFNINPANSQQEFLDNVQQVMKELEQALPEGHNLQIQSTAHFGSDYISKQPTIAKELGCSSDYNAYQEGAENPKPNVLTPFRTAAGHIHVGWGSGMDAYSKSHMGTCCDVVQLMDLYLGLPSVLQDNDKDRRKLYGQAGSFRPKEYGLEYRTLSNYWLKSSDLIKWSYDQTALVVGKFLEGMYINKGDINKIMLTINDSNTSEAERLLKKYKINYGV